MRIKLKYYPFWLLSMCAIVLVFSCKEKLDNQLDIRVKIDESLYGDQVSGKLIFLFDEDTTAQLKYGLNAYKPQPIFTYDIKHWNPKDTIFIKQFDNSWWKEYSDLDGEYAYIVYFDQDTLNRSSIIAKGNGYSEQYKSSFKRNTTNGLSIEISKSYKGWSFTESENIKEIKLRSPLLGEFWGYDMYIESAVVLPSDYGLNNRKYPIVYIFPGFGSNHAAVTYGTGQIDRYGMNTVGQDKIFVFMNAEFFQGYHHFTDSENNGPWSTAFTEEFIPFIESKYGRHLQSSQRFLMGQSSGAWTAIWLQVNYPDLFTATFAASPDPIDFRAHAFNIYINDSNFYFPVDPDSMAVESGKKKRLDVELEHLLGEFGQVRTWEATYSPRNEDGTIALLFDRNSGSINPLIADHWGDFDISRMISENPKKYEELLSGKLHIFVSRDDPYGLAKSVALFDEVLNENQINADIQFFNSLGHNVWTEKLRLYIHNIIDKW